MLKGLSGATIWSEDIKNLLPFYRDVLGLKAAYESPDFVGFGQRSDSGGYVGAYLGLGTHSEVKGKPSDPYLTWSGSRATMSMRTSNACLRLGSSSSSNRLTPVGCASRR